MFVREKCITQLLGKVTTQYDVLIL